MCVCMCVQSWSEVIDTYLACSLLGSGHVQVTACNGLGYWILDGHHINYFTTSNFSELNF